MRRVALTVFFLLATWTFAQTAGAPIWKPRLITRDRFPNSTVREVMVSDFDISDLKIVLEKTRLSDIQAKLGADEGHDGEAGDSLYWLCYRGRDADGPWALWLMAGEMDDGTVGRFQWRRIRPSERFDDRCPVLQRTKSKVKLPLTLRLGMPEADLVKMLGRPTRRYGQTLMFVHNHDEILNNQPYTVQNTVTVLIRDGKVSAVEVFKLTSS